MNKKLSAYLDALKSYGIVLETNIDDDKMNTDISCLTYDTREVCGSAIFVCKGAHFKEEYADYAMKNGAVVYVSEKKYDVDGPYILVSDIRRAMVYLAEVFFDNAPSKITSIGITGTKGKTTTTYYMRAVLDSYMEELKKPKCAVVSSIKTYDGVINEKSHLTTPEAIPLHRSFYNAQQHGMSYLVMEVSSQALKYDRVLGIDFDVACFTNIGLDHISPAEHSDFNDYFSSKLKIFDSCKNGCINMDAQYSDEVIEYAKGKCNIVTFGSSPEDTVYCSKIEKRDDKTFFTVRTPEFEEELSISMPGIFNVSNALAVIAMSYVLKIPKAHVINGLAHAQVEGRMQVFRSADKKISIIVDYAHNRLSFDALYRSVEVEYPGWKVVTVFGCPGNKALQRRHDLGELSGLHSDYVVITEDDPGEENVLDIAREIEQYVGSCEHDIIADRGKAIRKAVFGFKADKKVILIAGKGDETTQRRGTEYIDCPSDLEYAQRFLSEYDKL